MKAKRSPHHCLKLPETKTQSSLGKKTCSCVGRPLLCSWKMWNFIFHVEILYLFSKAPLCPPTLSYRTWKTHCSLQATPNILEKKKKMDKSPQQAENQHPPSFSCRYCFRIEHCQKRCMTTAQHSRATWLISDLKWKLCCSLILKSPLIFRSDVSNMHEWAHVFSIEWFQPECLAQILPPSLLDLENKLWNTGRSSTEGAGERSQEKCTISGSVSCSINGQKR